MLRATPALLRWRVSSTARSGGANEPEMGTHSFRFRAASRSVGFLCTWLAEPALPLNGDLRPWTLDILEILAVR